MLSAISKYLSEKIQLYKEVDPKPLVIEALMNGGLFTNQDGVLGLSKAGDNLWEVLFFATDNKEARKELVEEVERKLGKISIMFNRPKHSYRFRKYTYDFWKRLM